MACVYISTCLVGIAWSVICSPNTLCVFYSCRLFEDERDERPQRQCLCCRQPLAPGDVVIHSPRHTFHYDCFNCAVCGAVLQPRQPYILYGDQPVCLSDAAQLKRNSPEPSEPTHVQRKSQKKVGLYSDYLGKSAWV